MPVPASSLEALCTAGSAARHCATCPVPGRSDEPSDAVDDARGPARTARSSSCVAPAGLEAAAGRRSHLARVSEVWRGPRIRPRRSARCKMRGVRTDSGCSAQQTERRRDARVRGGRPFAFRESGDGRATPTLYPFWLRERGCDAGRRQRMVQVSRSRGTMPHASVTTSVLTGLHHVAIMTYIK